MITDRGVSEFVCEMNGRGYKQLRHDENPEDEQIIAAMGSNRLRQVTEK